MAVFVQTAPAGTVFDGTPGRGFIDLGSPVRIDAVNTSRQFVIAYLSVNCPGPGTINGVRMTLARDKANADGIDNFNFQVEDTNAARQWTAKGPIIVPNGYSLFVYLVGAGPAQEQRLMVFGGVATQLEGVQF